MTLLVDIEKKIGNFHLKAAFTMNHRENFGLLGESGCGTYGGKIRHKLGNTRGRDRGTEKASVRKGK